MKLTAKMNVKGNIEIFNNNLSVMYLQGKSDIKGFLDSLNSSQLNAINNFKYIVVLSDNLFYNHTSKILKD